MKKLQESEFGGLVLYPGDTFIVSYGDGKGNKRTLVEHTATKTEVFDTVAVYELEDGELGMEAGLAGVIGRRRAGNE